MHTKRVLQTALLASVLLAVAAIGRSGAPLRAQVPQNRCGNGVLDLGEECDHGQNNGGSDCSLECKILKCGDGIVSLQLGEQCEPDVMGERADDPCDTTYVKKSCGRTCTIPTRDKNGVCGGGCKVVNLAACPAVTSSSSAAAPPASSSASVAASAGTSSQAVSSSPASSSVSAPPVASSASSAAPAASSAASAAISSAAKSSAAASSVASNAAPSSTGRPTAVCGNGLLEAGEQCDAGVRNSDVNPDTCRLTCTLPHCGDSVKDTGEQCDQGSQNSDANPNACRANCTLPRCGDGVKDAGEQCDDGSRNSDTTTNACRTNCSLPRCGDGVKDANEECDDGLRNSDIAPGACRKSCKLPRCGDGIIDPGEQCDDANAAPGDGCDASCRIEDRFGCIGAPSTCFLLPSHGAASSSAPLPTECGDGIVQPGEECDDANKINDDGCTNSCKLPRCGDGIKQRNEECDDGPNNSMSSNACRPSCALPRCGDGVVDAGEQCDGGADCTKDCRINTSATNFFRTPGGKATLLGIMSTILLFSVLGFIFRRQIEGAVRVLIRRFRPTIDDVSLADIENPGTKI